MIENAKKMAVLVTEDAMNNENSTNRDKYLKIRKVNLHKMESIPVCKIPKK